MERLSNKFRRGMWRIRARSKGVFSNFDEQTIIERHLKELRVEKKFCVDIAASDGISMSNTYSLFRSGWAGLAVEFDKRKFAKLASHYKSFSMVALAKCMVTPENVAWLLKAYQTPKAFGLLNLDIDGYDYFVLEKILSEFRPSLICAEINEKIPPPVKFTVKWHPSYCWRGDHFYGQSISQLVSLCPKFNYSLIDLHYNNAFLAPVELTTKKPLTAEEAYRTGYLEQPDRKLRFPWNANMEPLLRLQPQEATDYVNNFFANRKGEFMCEL